MPLFTEWMEHNYEIISNQASIPDPTGWYLILVTGVSLSNSMTLADVIASEHPPVFGYERKQVALSTDPGTFQGSGISTYYKSAYAAVDAFTASGASISHDGAVLIADSTGVSAKLVETVDTSNERFTITAHGFSNGDPVVVSSDGTMPGSINPATIYYVKVISANIVELYTDVALITLQTISSAGSGNIYLRNAKGTLHSYVSYATRSIGDAAEQLIRVFLTEGTRA